MKAIANNDILTGSGELSACHLWQLPLLAFHLRARYLGQSIRLLLIVSFIPTTIHNHIAQ